jgi:uncharacterized protein
MKTALITGASGGIGYELAKVFAKNGYNLVLVARSEKKLQEIAADFEKQFKVKATVVAKDLTLPNAAQEVYDAVQKAGIAVDALVNNAGFATYGKFAELDTAREMEMIQVNIAVLTQLTRLFLPAMVQRGFGRIMNLASTAAFQPGPYMAVYYASKAYVLSFSEALSSEVAGTGVLVSALCPGPTKSGFQERADMEESGLLKLVKMMDSETVAWQGYKAMEKGKTSFVPGFNNRLLAFSNRFMPRRTAANLTKRIQKPAH